MLAVPDDVFQLTQEQLLLPAGQALQGALSLEVTMQGNVVTQQNTQGANQMPAFDVGCAPFSAGGTQKSLIELRQQMLCQLPQVSNIRNQQNPAFMDDLHWTVVIGASRSVHTLPGHSASTMSVFDYLNNCS